MEKEALDGHEVEPKYLRQEEEYFEADVEGKQTDKG